MEYKYRQNAGALNEVAAPAKALRSKASLGMTQSLVRSQSAELEQQQSMEPERTASRGLVVANAGIHAQTVGGGRADGRPTGTSGLDGSGLRQGGGMFHYTVRDGSRVLVIRADGTVEVVSGPSRVLRWGKRIEIMKHYVAHPGEFLIVRYRDGRQQHLEGPSDVWLDPRIHMEVTKEDALAIAAKEAIVVYSRTREHGEATADKQVARRIVHGPATFVPSPGEWLHTFSWHGSRGGEGGYEKVPNALVFQKLSLMPDQMYHDVSDVRTSDDAVLTIRLMLFFELLDAEIMLNTTHDPIGDFVNAATSDVVEMLSKHDLESFKRNTDKLNELDAYPQLVGRASQCGYRINKVVYRGYGAPDSLQRMHDEAIESRTRLQLERATMQQAQDLEDVKQTRAIVRASRERDEERATLEHELGQVARRTESEIKDAQRRAEVARKELAADALVARAKKEADDLLEAKRLDALKGLGVDLTKLLTQGRADQIIELRGQNGTPHLHLAPSSDSE